MTAPAVATRRPPGWGRLTWVAWRQHRAALAGVAVLLAVLGLYLLIMGLKIHQAHVWRRVRGTLAAFAMAAFAGALIRRTVPAMAAALAAWTVLDVTTMMALRQHYLAPLTGHGRNIPVSVWLLRVWPTPGGVPAYSYEPVGRFWAFQLIEGGWLLALALTALAGTVWLVRRSG
jgi:hypothetical protein